MQRLRDRRVAQLHKSKVIASVIAAIVISVVLLLSFEIYASWGTIGPDLAIYLLPGVAGQLDQGSVYVDFFDIKPPLTYAIFIPWIWIFGAGLLGLWILYAVILVTLFSTFWFLLRRLLSPWFALFLLIITAIILVGAGYLEDLFFVTESVGLALILGGLVLAIRYSATPFGLLVGSFMIGCAGQIKEVFIFAPLALLFLARDYQGGWRKGILWVVCGYSAAIFVTVTYLLVAGEGVFEAYLQVLSFKSEAFPRPDVPQLMTGMGELLSTIQNQWLPGAVLFGILSFVVLGLSRFRSNNNLSFKYEHRNTLPMSIFALWVSVVLGLLWQGRPMYGHYALPFLFATVLVIAVMLRSDILYIRTMPKPIVATVMSALLVLSLIPNPDFIGWLGGRINNFNLNSFIMSASEVESEKALNIFHLISEEADQEDCIHVAYGWEAASYYLYSARRPCTRFVVPPLWTNSALQAELRSVLVRSPPAVLVLDQSLQSELGVNGKGDRTIDDEVFPYRSVARACYTQLSTEAILWVPRTSNGVDLRQCIEAQLKLEGMDPSQ